jgi:hypothetical protein
MNHCSEGLLGSCNTTFFRFPQNMKQVGATVSTDEGTRSSPGLRALNWGRDFTKSDFVRKTK